MHGQPPTTPRPTWPRILPSLLLAAAAVWLSFSCASPLPYGDEYELTGTLTGRQPLMAPGLFARHNEHRIPLVRLVLAGLVPACGYDFRYAATAVPLCLGLAALVLAASVARARGRWLWTDNVPALLLLSFGHAESLTWSFAIQFTIHALLTAGFLACLTPALNAGAPTAGRILCGAAMIALLPGTGMNGFLMAACLLPVLAVSGWRHGSSQTRGIALTAATACLVELLAEFFTFPRLGGSGSGPATVAGGIVAFLSITAGPAARPVWPVVGGLSAAGLAAAAGLLAVLAVRTRRPALLAAPAVIGCGFLIALGVATQRVRASPLDAIQDRYFVLQALPLLAVFWAVGPSATPIASRVRPLLLGLAILVNLVNLPYGLRYAAAYKARHAALAADLEAGVPLRPLAEKYHAHPFGLYNPGAEPLYGHLDAYRQRALGPLGKAAPSPRCRRVELPGAAGRIDAATGHIVLDPPAPVHCLSWTWRAGTTQEALPASVLVWTQDAPDDEPLEYATDVGPEPRRESAVLDAPIRRIAFDAPGGGLEVGRIVIHVADE